MTQPIASLEKYPSIAGGILSYLIPGLGQIYQGRVAKGVLFMVCLLGMFIGGQALGDWHSVYIPTNAKPPGPEDNLLRRNSPRIILNIVERWHYAGQFWIGVAAWPAIWQYYNQPVPDAKDHPFWHNFERGPRDEKDEKDLNTYLTNHDKMPELAWVYTVVAGMLNILVIYDAFAGPAHGEGEGEKGRKGEGENG